MIGQPSKLLEEGPASAAAAVRAKSLTAAALVVTAAVLGLSLYANLSHLVTHRADFRFFPPFEAGVNRNNNEHLGAEYYCIAGALVAGRGFADPFREETGPTAWMPPVLAWLLAGMRWVSGNDIEIVMALFILLQDLTLIVTGVLVLALARRTTNHVWPAAIVFIGALLYYFRHCFQFTHDCWIVLLAIDGLIAGMVWLRPFESSKRRAFGWGVAGGVMALVSPVVGLSWAVLAVISGSSRGRRSRLVIAALASMVTVSPWMIRNYLVFGRFLPIKSNLAYELYQSQCLEPDGVLHSFQPHPFGHPGEERWEYKRVGEMKYLDKKWELFVESVRDDPMGRERWIVMGVYVTYLLPYVIVSFYDRYKFPLMVAEVLLIVWGLHRLARMLWRGGPQETDVEDAIMVAEEPEAAGTP